MMIIITIIVIINIFSLKLMLAENRAKYQVTSKALIEKLVLFQGGKPSAMLERIY